MIKDKTEYSYICKICGYKAVKMGRLSECPLCKPCPRCGKPIINCICIVSE